MKMIDGGKDPTKEYPNNADFILWPTIFYTEKSLN